MSIIKKIAAIRDGLKIEKSGYDERNDYHYFKGEDVAAGVRRGMVEHGVIHRTKLVEYVIENIIDKQGRVRPAASGLYEFSFIDIDTGDSFEVQAVASGSDIGGDKATRKMAVQAFKIACIDLFTVVEDMGSMDADNYAEAPSLNEGAEPESEEPTEKPLDAKSLGNTITELIKDPSQEHITAEVVNTVGNRVCKEVLGEELAPGKWRRDARVLEGLIAALNKGDLT